MRSESETEVSGLLGAKWTKNSVPKDYHSDVEKNRISGARINEVWLYQFVWDSQCTEKRTYRSLRDRLKNTLKPMKWNIFHFSLDPLPPSQKWNSVLLLASFYDGKHKHEAFFFLKKWNSDHEIAYPLPPLVKNISLHWLQGIFETVPKKYCKQMSNKQATSLCYHK